MINRGVSVIPKSNSQDRIPENFDCLFDVDQVDFQAIDTILGLKEATGTRNFETRHYVGFDTFNEEAEEP